MAGLKHVKREKSSNVNIVSCAVSDATLQRLDKRCAQLDVPRSLVARDFVELCLDIADVGGLVEFLAKQGAPDVGA
jgi:hypothetical protein